MKRFHLSDAEIKLLFLNLRNKHVFLGPAKSILEEILKKIIESSIEIVFDGYIPKVMFKIESIIKALLNQALQKTKTFPMKPIVILIKKT